jgi:hypothetical protein
VFFYLDHSFLLDNIFLNNEPGYEPTRFTNKDSLNKAEMEFHGKFIASGTPPDLTSEYKDHYVTEFKYGIVYGQMTTNFIRSKTLSTIVNLIKVMKKMFLSNIYYLLTTVLCFSI